MTEPVQSGSRPVDRAATEPDPQRLADLVQRAAKRDETAWKDLIDLYSRRVFAMAKSRCADPVVAEEITQSVFATIATKLSSGQYAEQGRFEAWLFRVTMNRIRDEARRVKRHAQPTDPVELGVVEGRSQTAPPADETALARLREAMAALSDVDREVIELRHHGGMSFKQMARMLEEPVGTLLARHHRALRKLRQIIESDPERPVTDRPEEVR